MPDGVTTMCLRNKSEKWQTIVELPQRECNVIRSDAAIEETVRVLTKKRDGKPEYVTQVVYVNAGIDEWAGSLPVMAGEIRRKQ